MFVQEPYLYLVKEQKYRKAMAKIRTGSHTLAIERGRYERPKIPVERLLCNVCNCIEDELHFTIKCSLYDSDRAVLFSKLIPLHPPFSLMTDMEKCIFLITTDDRNILTWLGKFLHKAFFTINSRICIV